ncbi:MAG: class I SAM-dependent methyltransferase, partial [Muribaculaceae bacterium]|nr:class I SAM-dependent methyltransferase [Muribaculaceae bacterium]
LITVAYGVSNFENLLRGLTEMRRVLRPKGVLCVIELSVPQGKLTGLGYRLYSRRLIPIVGKMVSGDSRAYTYLPESIAAAPQRDARSKVMKEAGFGDVTWKELTFGAVTYYLAQ